MDLLKVKVNAGTAVTAVVTGALSAYVAGQVCKAVEKSTGSTNKGGAAGFLALVAGAAVSALVISAVSDLSE